MIAGLSEEEFKNFTASLIAEKLEKDKTLGQETNRFWREICNECYVFDRAQREVQAIETLTHKDLIDYYNKRICFFYFFFLRIISWQWFDIAPDSPDRRKVSIQIWTKESLHEHENPTLATPSPAPNGASEVKAEAKEGEAKGETKEDSKETKEGEAKESKLDIYHKTPVLIRDYVEWKRRQAVSRLPTPGIF